MSNEMKVGQFNEIPKGYALHLGVGEYKVSGGLAVGENNRAVPVLIFTPKGGGDSVSLFFHTPAAMVNVQAAIIKIAETLAGEIEDEGAAH